MLPVGILMSEHRLILRMISLMRDEEARIRSKGIPDFEFLGRVTDFFGNFVDRCHHGKEEDVLFRRLSGKPLTPEHSSILTALLQEHRLARQHAAALLQAKERVCSGDYSAVLELAGALNAMTGLYTGHIDKEDKHFFLPVMQYFTEDDQAAIIRQNDEFDRRLYIDSYSRLVENAEAVKQ